MINGKYYVTLCTDGSANSHRVGMAYYLRDDRGVNKKAWYEDGNYEAYQAEWLALEAALELIKQKSYPPNSVLVYYCDCDLMLRIMRNDFSQTKAKKRWKVKTDWVKEMLAGFESIDIRYVEAHTLKNYAAKFYLNRWCDYNARAMVRYGRMHENHTPHKQMI